MSNETAEAARVDALGYVEQTIYANEGTGATITWCNAEVLEMLGEIAERLRLDVSGGWRTGRCRDGAHVKCVAPMECECACHFEDDDRESHDSEENHGTR